MKRIKNSLRESIHNIRPHIKTIDHQRPTNAAEKFQNETLRPILKFQNDLIIVVYEQYLNDRKTVLSSLPESKRMEYIADSLKKDQRLRNTMLGMVMGLFTETEYQQYATDKRELSKRAVSMLIQRLQDQLL